MFDATGVQSVLTPNTTADTSSTLTGYYPCDDPPDLGFGFPSKTNATTASQEHSSNTSHHSTIFNMLPEALVYSTSGNDCTASIYGTDGFGELWIIGQGLFPATTWFCVCGLELIVCSILPGEIH